MHKAQTQGKTADREYAPANQYGRRQYAIDDMHQGITSGGKQATINRNPNELIRILSG